MSNLEDFDFDLIHDYVYDEDGFEYDDYLFEEYYDEDYEWIGDEE